MAAANMFLKFEPDIKGDSQQKSYENQIEVTSFEFEVAQRGGFDFAKGGTRSSAELEDLKVSFRMCSASPKIMEYCASGEHLTKATLTCVKASGSKAEKFLEVKLTDIVISGYRTSINGNTDVPVDTVKLNFAQMEKEYFLQDNKGATTSAGKGKWNQQKNSRD